MSSEEAEEQSDRGGWWVSTGTEEQCLAACEACRERLLCIAKDQYL